jgi:hypothetical protein
VLWSQPSVDPLTILLIKLLKSYSLVLSTIDPLVTSMMSAALALLLLAPVEVRRTR